MRNLIRKILREENEKTPKSKLINLLEKPNGLVKLLNGGFTIEDICDITEIDHPGGTMVYWEDANNWEEFEYKPNGIVLVTDETDTREEQW